MGRQPDFLFCGESPPSAYRIVQGADLVFVSEAIHNSGGSVIHLGSPEWEDAAGGEHYPRLVSGYARLWAECRCRSNVSGIYLSGKEKKWQNNI